MGRKKTRKDSWEEKRDQEEARAGEIAATLPESKDELLEVARLAMQALDFAVLVHALTAMESEAKAVSPR